MLKEKGFTLIELLVVILIISVLIAIALPQYHKAVTRAKNREAISAIRAIGQGIELYNLETGEGPNLLNENSLEDPSFKISEMWDFSKLNIQPPDSKNWRYYYFCFARNRCVVSAHPIKEEDVGDITYYLSGKTDEQGHFLPFIYVIESELTERTVTTDPITHETITNSRSESRSASAEICALAAGRMDPEEGCVID